MSFEMSLFILTVIWLICAIITYTRGVSHLTKPGYKRTEEETDDCIVFALYAVVSGPIGFIMSIIAETSIKGMEFPDHYWR